MTQTFDPPDAVDIGPPSEPPRAPTRSRRSWPRRLVTPLLFVLAIGAGLVATPLVLSQFHPHRWSGTVLPNAEAAPPLDGLSFDDGSPADLGALDADVVIMFFGYTNCPDVCPLTLSIAAEAIESLGDDADRVRLAMVSVDPARDSLEELGPYVRAFHPGFVGATGSEEATNTAGSLYGVFLQLQDPDGNDFYLVDHTASLMGVGPDGTLDIIWSPTITADELADDLAEMLS